MQSQLMERLNGVAEMLTWTATSWILQALWTAKILSVTEREKQRKAEWANVAETTTRDRVTFFALTDPINSQRSSKDINFHNEMEESGKAHLTECRHV